MRTDLQSRLLRTISVLSMLFIVGCGQGSYDELIRQQISEVGTWRPYQSELGYVVKVPEGVETTPEADDSTDLLEFKWKGHTFRVEGLKTNNPDIDAEATKLKEYYTSQAYEGGEPSNVSIDRLKGKTLAFTNPEADDLRIQIVSFRDGMVSMMVSAPSIQDRIAQQFFGSVEHKPVQRGRR